MASLKKATMEDIAKALDPNGKPVDVHRAAAAVIFGVPYERVTDGMRKDGKHAAHFYIYGGRHA